jgi:hypothetical protein
MDYLVGFVVLQFGLLLYVILAIKRLGRTLTRVEADVRTVERWQVGAHELLRGKFGKGDTKSLCHPLSKEEQRKTDFTCDMRFGPCRCGEVH